MVYNKYYAGVLELADEVDSKSIGSNTVRVQVPPPAPYRVFIRDFIYGYSIFLP